jgi:Predicted sugar phosphate isomerase involved in capsule formation
VDAKEMSLKVCNEVCEALNVIDNAPALKMIRAILTSERIFVAGTGRSNLAGKFFAHRLVDLAFDAYVVGETITPSARVTDCIIGISGSGGTTYTLNALERGRKVGAKLIGITSYLESTLGKMVDTIIIIPGREIREKNHQDYLVRQIRGSMEDLDSKSGVFEIACGIFFESIIHTLNQKVKKG